MKSRKRQISLLVIGVITIAIVYQVVMPHLRDNNDWPNWNGVKPGITRPWQVQELVGEPSYLELCPFNLSGAYPIGYIERQPTDWEKCLKLPLALVYDGTIQAQAEAKIVTTLTTVRYVYVVEDMVSIRPDIPLSDFMIEHGTPDKIEWSRRNSDYRVIIYCEKGLAAQTAYSQIVGIIYFMPQATDRCSSISDLSLEMASENPFPDPDRPRPASLDIWGEDWSRKVIEKMQE